MSHLKIRAIGNSVGVVLPQEILKKMKCREGDELFWLETENGIELTPYDPEFAEDMVLAEDIMLKNRNMLKKLAE